MHEIKLDNLNRILVIRFSSLGDILLTTPLLRSIKKKFPGIKLDYLIRQEFSDAIKNNPYLNNIYLLKRGEDISSLIAVLNNNNYDMILDLQNNLRSKRITGKLNCRAARYKKPSIKKFMLVNLKINLLKKIITIPERYAAALGKFELDDEGLDLYLPGSTAPDLKNDKKYIGLCPGSKHFTKQWPKEYFIELGNLLRSNGLNVVLFGGGNDIGICEEICEQIDGAINLSNNNNLFQTSRNMKQCSAVICNDSGLMHTAAALRVPVLAIFGSTVREFGFAPYKSKNLILENNLLSCRPCSHIGRSRCPKRHFMCMKEMTAELVFDQFKKYYSSL